MKKSYYYPAIFHKAKEGGYFVSFAGMPGCNTQGDDFYSAYEMCIDAIGLYLEENIINDTMPDSIDPSTINHDEKDAFIVMIEFKPEEYLRQNNEHSIKKTLTIPTWLNELSIKRGLKFSQILQEALKKELGL